MFLLEWKIQFCINGYFEKNWDSPLEYVVSLFNASCNTNITKKIQKLYSILTILLKKQHKCSCQWDFV